MRKLSSCSKPLPEEGGTVSFSRSVADRDESCPPSQSNTEALDQNSDGSGRDARYRGNAYLGAL